MGLIQQVKSRTEISIKRNFSRKEYYENAKEYLINPVQKLFYHLRLSDGTFEEVPMGIFEVSEANRIKYQDLMYKRYYKPVFY